MDVNIITKFVTLCPKVYTINYEEYDSNHKIKTSKRAKGTKNVL